MNWQKTVNSCGWKVPLLGKSLFQIGKELRPRIDHVIMRNSLIPDQAIQDKTFFPWVAELEKLWEPIRDEAVRIRAEDIPRWATSLSTTAELQPIDARARFF